MKSVKLSVNVKEKIVATLLQGNPYQVECKKLEEKLVQLTKPILERTVPTEIMSLMGKEDVKPFINKVSVEAYPYNNWESFIVYKGLPHSGTRYHISFKDAVKDVITQTEDESVAGVICKMKNCRQKESDFERKLSCALSAIKTSAELKREFPEAYDSWVKITEAKSPEPKKENKCDQMEAVRATLSTYKNASK